MSLNTVLWLGFGDIGQRCVPLLVGAGFTVDAVARSEKSSKYVRDMYRADVNDSARMAQILRIHYDLIVVTLTPSGRTEADYRRAYYDTISSTLNLFTLGLCEPQQIIFISSTSVYSQNNGELINEDSAAEPLSATAKVLLETEELLKASSIPVCTLRFSGIYGPGRYHLLRSVMAGAKGDESWTNRIHVDDCAGVIAFLAARYLNGKFLPNVILASDNLPVKSCVMYPWLAQRLSPRSIQELTYKRESVKRAGINKRCNNGLLRKLGYRFKYEDYRRGFEDIVRQFLQCQD